MPFSTLVQLLTVCGGRIDLGVGLLMQNAHAPLCE